MNRFQEQLKVVGYQLTKTSIDILQVNLGKFCNIACIHCHVEAGPNKKEENMNRLTAEAVVRFLDRTQIKTLDLTGGAPELNPNFKYLVLEARKRHLHVIDRCNLTVFYENGMEGVVDFLATNQVEIIASLPCYHRENVDKQRGRGVFDRSIQALLDLNAAGYGKPETHLELNLVYNPVSAHLPPEQSQLEEDYKKRLSEDFGIVFNKLYCITNMPITRYAKFLQAQHQYDSYVELLINSFNPYTLDGLMCRNTLSVSWDGKLYDCDFNQALGMQMRNGKPLTIEDAIARQQSKVLPKQFRTGLLRRTGRPAPKDQVAVRHSNNRRRPDGLLAMTDIQTGDHCFGCTAGAGSSCQGALNET